MLFLGRAANFKAGDIWRHTFAFGTKKHSERLTQHLAHRYDVPERRVHLYHSGRSAICAGLKQLLPEGGEVIINGLTCYAVVQSVQMAGCTPVFADVKKDKTHFDARSLAKVITKHPKAKAVIVQNTLGIPIEVKAIEAIVKKQKMFLIEDLAHCTGVKYRDGREVGTVGDAAMLSFGKGKSIDTSAGGALILRHKDVKMSRKPTCRPKVSESLRDRWYPFFGACTRGLTHIRLDKIFIGALRFIHFIEPSADTRLALNTRLTHWQAKLALRQMEQIPRIGRKPIRGFCLVKNRSELLKVLEKKGFYFGEIWYDCPVSPVRYYEKVNFPEEDCPQSVQVSDEIINIPTYYSAEELRPALKIIKRYQK